MTMMADHQILEYLNSNKLIENLHAVQLGKDSKIQPSSIDLTIGQCYVPGDLPIPASSQLCNEQDSYILKPGHMVLVKTRESLNVPNDLAGIGCPPAAMAVKGLLMVNPGHIDPGFVGVLTLVLINMGKKDFVLRCGDKIFTTMWFKLQQPVELSYTAQGHQASTDVRSDNIKALNQNFLDIEERAGKVFRRQISLLGIAGLVLSTLIALLLAIIPAYFSANSEIASKYLEEIRKKDRSAIEQAQNELTISKLIAKNDILESRIVSLESALQKPGVRNASKMPTSQIEVR